MIKYNEVDEELLNEITIDFTKKEDALMKKGIIIKGIGGFYDVKLDDDVLRCNARGKFRKDGIIPMVGDKVEVNTKDAVIETIMPRKINSGVPWYRI